jgi:small-conductance mechanosensitive channel
MFRRRRPPEPVDVVQPSTLPVRWSPAVQRVLTARASYRQLVGSLRAGPLRERVVALGERVDAGVLAVWEAAQRAAELEAVLGAIDASDATAAHKEAKRELEQARRAGAVPAGLEERAQALAQRHASVQRLQNVLDDTDGQLTVLEARLEAAVARIAELAFRPDEAGASLTADLDDVVDELGALRQALDGFDRGHG